MLLIPLTDKLCKKGQNANNLQIVCILQLLPVSQWLGRGRCLPFLV